MEFIFSAGLGLVQNAPSHWNFCARAKSLELKNASVFQATKNKVFTLPFDNISYEQMTWALWF